MKPNLTSHLQPIDAGIISNFKFYCRKGLLRHFIEAADLDKPLDINLKEALSLTKLAWGSVKPETVSNCWLHTGIINSQNSSCNSSTKQDSIIQELDEQIKVLHSSNMTAEKWVSIDQDEPTSNLLTDKDILEVVQPIVEELDEEDMDVPLISISSKDALQAVHVLVSFIEQNSSQP